MTMNTGISFGYQAIKSYAESHELDKGRNNLSSEIDKIIVLIKDALSREEDSFLESAQNLFSELFNLRTLTVKWISEYEIDLSSTILELEDDLNEFAEDEVLGFLADNALFAIRTQKRVSNGFAIEKNRATDIIQEMPDYDQLISVLNLIKKNDPSDLVSVLMALINNSLLMDLSLIATDLVLRKKIAVSADRIAELNEVLVDGAQSFGGAFYTLKNFSKEKEEETDEYISENELEEQRLIAEEGIEDYNQMLASFE